MAKKTEIGQQALAFYNTVKTGRSDKEILALAEKVATARGWQAHKLGAFKRSLKRHLARRQEVIRFRMAQNWAA